MMKRVFYSLLAVLLLVIGRGVSAAPPIPPPPTEWVTDTLGFLSDTTRQTLNVRLETYERASGHQALVWVGKTTGDAPIEDWTARAFKAWSVGRKGLDDGLILFVFVDDRKARVEVGYGLEGDVPDATASRILNEIVIPRIKTGDHDSALTLGVEALITDIGGAGVATENAPPPPKPMGLGQKIAMGFLIIIVILLAIRYPTVAFYLFSTLFSRGGRDKGGGFGGGGGRSGGGGATGRW